MMKPTSTLQELLNASAKDFLKFILAGTAVLFVFSLLTSIIIAI